MMVSKICRQRLYGADSISLSIAFALGEPILVGLTRKRD